MKILFVCSSNICRSPYAEYVFRRIVENSPVLSANVSSVRSSAVFNKSFAINKKTVAALLAEGFSEKEVLAHKPTFKWGSPQLFEDADVIIGMTKSHKAFTPCKYKAKFLTLSEVAVGKYVAIPDPFLETSQEKYNEVMSVIKEYLVLYAEKLEKKFESKN